MFLRMTRHGTNEEVFVNMTKVSSINIYRDEDGPEYVGLKMDNCDIFVVNESITEIEKMCEGSGVINIVFK